jgi:hypothetical protein
VKSWLIDNQQPLTYGFCQALAQTLQPEPTYVGVSIKPGA